MNIIRSFQLRSTTEPQPIVLPSRSTICGVTGGPFSAHVSYLYQDHDMDNATFVFIIVVDNQSFPEVPGLQWLGMLQDGRLKMNVLYTVKPLSNVVLSVLLDGQSPIKPLPMEKYDAPQSR